MWRAEKRSGGWTAREGRSSREASSRRRGTSRACCSGDGRPEDTGFRSEAGLGKRERPAKAGEASGGGGIDSEAWPADAGLIIQLF